MTARRALFLDRDGTLIADVGYPRDPDRVVLLPGAAAALRTVPADVALVIITNQSGIGRGLITPAEADAVEARVAALFAREGVTFAGAYRCPHGPDDGCPCRKPRPGLLLQAAADLHLDLARSLMVGDKPSDVAAGHAAGTAALHFAIDATDDDPAIVIGWPALARRIATHFLLQ